jgi:gas vesicle protein
MQKFISFFTGAVIGGLVGVTLALLLAPYSGEQLRLQMQERTQRLQGEIKVAANARRAELERQLATMRSPRSSASD